MKKRILLLVTFMMYCTFMLNAQDILHVDTYNSTLTGDYCLKVYVHKVTKSDGSGGVSDASLNTQITSLNNYFTGTGISFHWDENINPIENDIIYNTEFIYSGSCDPPSFNSLNSNSNPDGIDLFFFGRNDQGSIANGIADRTQLIIGPNDLNNNVIAHELGHILGLFHTYHGTIEETACENNDNMQGSHISECANAIENSFNRRSGGDFVADTEAYNGYLIGSSNCSPIAGGDGSFDGCGSGPRDPGDPFKAPDADNFMSGFDNCGNTFTDLQIKRMKYFLGNSSLNLELHEAIMSSCTPDGCNSCENTYYYAHEIFFGESQPFTFPPSEPTEHIELNDTSVTFNLMPSFFTIPQGIEACSYDFSIMLPGTSNFVSLNSLMGQTRNFTGDSTLTLKVSLNGVEVCCYQINANTPDPLNYARPKYIVMEQLQIACPDDNDCENPCNIDASYSLQMNNICLSINNDPGHWIYNGTNLGTVCPEDNYSYKWTIKNTGNGNENITGNESVLDLVGSMIPYQDTNDIYEIKLTIANLSNNCSDSYSQFYTAIDFWHCYLRLSLSPNPVKPNSELQFEGIDIKDVKSIELFDLFGNSKMKINPKRNSFKVPELQSGLYIVKFYTSKGIEQKKLVIE